MIQTINHIPQFSVSFSHFYHAFGICFFGQFVRCFWSPSWSCSCWGMCPCCCRGGLPSPTLSSSSSGCSHKTEGFRLYQCWPHLENLGFPSIQHFARSDLSLTSPPPLSRVFDWFASQPQLFQLLQSSCLNPFLCSDINHPSDKVLTFGTMLENTKFIFTS